MIDRFHITLITLDESKDMNTLTLGLSELADGSGFYMLLERSLSFTDQDRRAGLDTYSISLPVDAVHYGGIASCKLIGSVLAVRFEKKAAKALDVGGFDFELKVDGAAIERLKAGLQRVFTPDDQPAVFHI